MSITRRESSQCSEVSWGGSAVRRLVPPFRSVLVGESLFGCGKREARRGGGLLPADAVYGVGVGAAQVILPLLSD